MACVRPKYRKFITSRWWTGAPLMKDEKIADLTQEDWQRLYGAINFEDKPVVNVIEPAEVSALSPFLSLYFSFPAACLSRLRQSPFSLS